MRLLPRLLALVTLASVSLVTPPSQAFCGFYVSGATGELFNNATQVVLMREGTRTVLSMANNYQGPPADFAMVVPVPVVLQKENVKTLPRELFQKIDQLDAPRLVEYWEKDPCAPEEEGGFGGLGLTGIGFGGGGSAESTKSLGVKIEAQFTVGEYEVVILSAKDSTGLDTWLRQNKYNIPPGAEPLLKPYVAAGSKFFVAKVDVEKVKKEGDKTMLSPLRFHYDTDRFELPVRLGLINSSGKQDLLVHILAKGKRYEVANYPNVTIPTNLDVGEITKEQFATFYAALFDQTLEKHPKAVVTEYSWDASFCDPCPGPAISAKDITTLGGDVMKTGTPEAPSGIGMRGGGGYVLTRLHARYGKDSLGEDLVFKEAPPITGGREVRRDGKTLEQGATRESGGINNFQGRYAIRHPWKGEVACKEPRFGRWGGPPGDKGLSGLGSFPRPQGVKEVAFAPRGQTPLTSFLAQDVKELDVKGQAAPVSPVPGPSASAAPVPSASAAPTVTPTAGPTSSATATLAPTSSTGKGCGGCAVPVPQHEPQSWVLPLLGLGLLASRRHRRTF